MFKVTMGNDGYSLYQYNIDTGRYKILLKNTTIDSIVRYNKYHLKNHIRIDGMDGLHQALKEVADSHYNTLEFGVKGTYTIPLHDPNVI